MALALKIDVKGVDVLAGRLRAIGDDAPKAVLRALRRTRSTVMTRIARVVSQASGLGARRVRKSLHGSKPEYAAPRVFFTLWGGRDQLVRYGRGIQGTSMPRSAFRARMPQGHIGFFERRPGTSSLHNRPERAISKMIRPGVWHTLPIDEVYGPPFTRFLSGPALTQILSEAGDVFRKNLEHEIAFRESRQTEAV